MNVVIVPSDGLVVVDGVSRLVDLSSVAASIRGIQFNTLSGNGRIWSQAANGDCSHADVHDFTPYQIHLDAWTAAAPPAPGPPVDLSNIDNIQKELKALALCIAQVGGLTVPQIKTLFAQKWNLLP